MSIADTYRAMSDDVRRAAKEAGNEGAHEAYLALADLWWKAALRADGFPKFADENVVPSLN